MHYTIGEVSKKTNITSHTLRYYAKEGLLPFVTKSAGGIRQFKQQDIEWLTLVQCLKNTGMSIKDIKQFVDWIIQGDDTISQRLELFREQQKKVEQQIKALQITLTVIKNKRKYYEIAKEAGTTAVHNAPEE